jgi:hypothetical protein
MDENSRQNRAHAESVADRRLSRSWAINNKEMEKRERLRKEIEALFGKVDPDLRKKYTLGYE